MALKLPKIAQKLAPAKKNSRDISPVSPTFCISGMIDNVKVDLPQALLQVVPLLLQLLDSLLVAQLNPGCFF